MEPADGATGAAAHLALDLDVPDGPPERVDPPTKGRHHLPIVKPKRVRARRAHTISVKRLPKYALERERMLYPPHEDALYERPTTRADCLPGGCNEARPCPFVSCAHHLYLDVNEHTGSIKVNFPELEVWQLRESCALDVADRGGATLEEVGGIMNLTRERIRMIQDASIDNIRSPARALLTVPVDAAQPPPTPDEPVVFEPGIERVVQREAANTVDYLAAAIECNRGGLEPGQTFGDIHSFAKRRSFGG